jgi:hypothetical protein
VYIHDAVLLLSVIARILLQVCSTGLIRMVTLQVITMRSWNLVPSLYTITHIMVVLTTTMLVTTAALQEIRGAVPKGLSHPVEFVKVFRVCKSVHLHTFKWIYTSKMQQLITGLLLVVQIQLVFRVSSCPSSGAYQLQQQPLAYRRNVVVAVLLVVAGLTGPATTNSTATTTFLR